MIVVVVVFRVHGRVGWTDVTMDRDAFFFFFFVFFLLLLFFHQDQEQKKKKRKLSFLHSFLSWHQPPTPMHTR